MNKYLCLHCGEVYDNTHEPKTYKKDYNTYSLCPKSSCSGKVVEIDELMIPTIKELNSKGYKTVFSCSGHLYESCVCAYIKFEDERYMPITSPEGWERDNILFSIYATPYIVYKQKLTDFEIYKKIVQANVEFYEWATKLEQCKEDREDD